MSLAPRNRIRGAHISDRILVQNKYIIIECTSKGHPNIEGYPILETYSMQWPLWCIYLLIINF